MLGLGQVIRPGVNWRSNETRLIQVYMIEIVGISRPHSGTSSALNSNPSQQRYPIEKHGELTDLIGSLLEADGGSRCRAETHPTDFPVVGCGRGSGRY